MLLRSIGTVYAFLKTIPKLQTPPFFPSNLGWILL
jgi:hypothetical protein